MFQIYFSLHSYGEKVMYPWSYTNQKLPDWQELHSVGIVIADAIEAIAGLPYWVRNIVSKSHKTSISLEAFAFIRRQLLLLELT